MEGGSPRRGHSPGPFSVFDSPGRRDSAALQEDDIRDAKGRVGSRVGMLQFV